MSLFLSLYIIICIYIYIHLLYQIIDTYEAHYPRLGCVVLELKRDRPLALDFKINTEYN